MAAIRIPLPSRATSPGSCGECDGFALGDTRLCADCTDAGFFERLAWRYENDEGIRKLVDHESEQIGRVEAYREFHPTSWRLGISFELSLDHPHVGAGLLLGPWTWSASWRR